MTFVEGTAWCAITNACYNIPADCPAPENHNCQTGECVCPTGQSWCLTTKACVAIPECCNTHDNCGTCIDFKIGTGFCELTNACYNLPVDCPIPANHNCQTGECICQTGFSWCVEQKTCVAVPSCCLTNNNCGRCLTFVEGTAWCAENNQCYNIPATCPELHNCVTGECLCTESQTYCENTKQCVDVPICCATNDNCGNCLTLLPNWIFDQGVCLEKVSVENCDIFAPNFQTCIRCVAPNILSQDGLKCFPPIKYCTRYDVALSTAESLTCLSCEFPYSLMNNECVIPRCLDENTEGPVLTCNECLSNDARNAAHTICYPPIEKCTKYYFQEPYGYGCEECEFTYLPNAEKSLCIAAGYMIMGYNASKSDGASDNGFFFALNLSRTFVWTAYSSILQTSGWSVLWYLQSYNNGAYFTVRTILREFDVVLGANAEKAYYIISNTNKVTIQEGFSTQGASKLESGIPTTNLQFVFQRAIASSNSVWFIKSVSTGLYLTYGTTLTATPVPFLLKR